MASPFTTAERNKILQIAGIPPGGKTMQVNALVLYPFSNVDSWQSQFFSNGDLSAVVTQIDDLLNNHTDADTGNAVRECFALWDQFKFSEITVTNGANGVAGKIVDAREKCRQIRRYVANLIGFFVPMDGYLHEIEAILGKSISEYRKSNGDR